MSFHLHAVRYDFTIALVYIFSMISNNPHYLMSLLEVFTQAIAHF